MRRRRSARSTSGPRARCHPSASACSRRSSHTCSTAAARTRRRWYPPPTSWSASTSRPSRWRSTSSSPPRLTPLEARAIRLALEFVGPMIAADAHTPLDRVRRKLEETFGQFDLSQTAEPRSTRAEEKLVGSLSEGIRQSRLVEIEYQKEGEESLSTRVVEPHVIERELPYWYIHTWDRTRDAQRSI